MRWIPDASSHHSLLWFVKSAIKLGSTVIMEG